VNIYIAHYHFEEISSTLGGRSSVNTACSQCPLEVNWDMSCDDSAGANCSSHQMVNPLTVNAVQATGYPTLFFDICIIS